MAYSANELISNAYYIANIVSREFETPSGQQLSDGLNILNDLIADKSANNSMISYSAKYEFNAVAATSEYYVPGLLYADTLTFYIDTKSCFLHKTKRM